MLLEPVMVLLDELFSNLKIFFFFIEVFLLLNVLFSSHPLIFFTSISTIVPPMIDQNDFLLIGTSDAFVVVLIPIKLIGFENYGV